MKLSTALAGAACALAAMSFAYAADPLAPAGAPVQPAPPPVQPVTEVLYGQSVTDNYRFMEKLDPATVDWMKAQGAYTRTMIDAILGGKDGAARGDPAVGVDVLVVHHQDVGPQPDQLSGYLGQGAGGELVVGVDEPEVLARGLLRP